MNLDLYSYILDLTNDSEALRDLYQEAIVPPRTTLLEAGNVSQNFYFIKQGAARLWFNHDGRDVTLQFFFEGQGVASLESFLRNTPSLFSLETIEPTTVWIYKKAVLEQLLKDFPSLHERLHELTIDRLISYTHLFLSRIKDSPQQRYENLLTMHPEILRRVPQHYIASYLGITPVSLSRIRNRR